MMKPKKAARAASMTIAAVMLAPPVLADEKGLIWAPKKLSDRSYSARVGVRLPVDTRAEAGIEMGLAASESSALVDTPVRLWSDVTMQSAKTPASSHSSNLGVVMNALTGNVAVKVTTTERHIATSTLDVEMLRDYSLRYNGQSGQWQKLDVSQTVRLDRKESGTALFVKALGTEAFDKFSASTGIEQKIGDNITLRGAMERGSAGHNGSVNARYSIRW